MNTIMEAELADCARNKAIKKMHLVQLLNGNFSVEVELTWKDGRVCLITQKKVVREWANLNRLVQHIQSSYGAIPLITVIPLIL